jgi:aspartate 1-decarboxylase
VIERAARGRNGLFERTPWQRNVSHPADVNGAAARKALVGDLLIITAYASYGEEELKAYQPVIVLVNERNRPVAAAK